MDIEAIIAEHNVNYYERVRKIQILAAKIIPILDNPMHRNAYLSRKDPGLTINESATVAPLESIPDPTNQSQVGRFAYSFAMREVDETGNDSRPISTQTLQNIATNGLRGINFDRYRDHRARPAYYRAVAIMPGFFINLTSQISDAEQPPAILGPDLFLAYQVMSRLIDNQDPGLLRPDRSTDRAYLFRRTVLFDNHLSIAS